MKRAKKMPQRAVGRQENNHVQIPEIQRLGFLSWRLSTVDFAGPFAWPVGTQEEVEIIDKLRSFDSMQWSEVPGKGHHAIDVGQLSKEARDRLEEIKRDDIDEVFSFRVSGRARIIGIRDVNVVKLLWWDPEHRVCPSQKKHT